VTLVKKGGVFAAEYLITQSSVYWWRIYVGFLVVGLVCFSLFRELWLTFFYPLIKYISYTDA